MLKIVNKLVPLGLKVLGYDDHEIKAISEYIDEKDTIEGAPNLDDDHLDVFDCAFKPAKGTRSILWRSHVKMMAAAQPFISGAISKTVNMPTDTTPEDIAEAYIWGWKEGLKALAVYRDGSKLSQPLNTKSDGENAKDDDTPAAKPKRERLPDTRQSLTHKFNVAGHEGYITVGLYDDGRPGELFITMAKEGSTVGGLMDCFGIAVSMSLQYGVPLEVLVNKFSHTRFEPMGQTKSPDIRIATSVVDYIFRWLGITFLAGYKEVSNGLKPDQSEDKEEKSSEKASANGAATDKPATNGNGKVDFAMLERAGVSLNTTPDENRGDQFARFQSDAPSCDKCGAITVRNGNCYLCHNCGNSMGCS